MLNIFYNTAISNLRKDITHQFFSTSQVVNEQIQIL